MLQEIKTDSHILLGVDPGGTTGYAMWSGWGEKNFRAGQIEGRHEFLAALDTAIGWGYPMVWVVERFVITPSTTKMTPQYDALYIIGAMDYMAEKLGHVMVCQSPADAKKFATDEKLHKLGWYDASAPHGMDAARHVALYLAKLKDPTLLEKVLA